MLKSILNNDSTIKSLEVENQLKIDMASLRIPLNIYEREISILQKLSKIEIKYFSPHFMRLGSG